MTEAVIVVGVGIDVVGVGIVVFVVDVGASELAESEHTFSLEDGVTTNAKEVDKSVVTETVALL